jgi:hypothetical protein
MQVFVLQLVGRRTDCANQIHHPCIGLERGGNFCRAQVLASRAIMFFNAAGLKLQLKTCRRPKRLHIHQVVVASEDGERIGPTWEILQNAPDILRRRRER